MIQSGMDCVKHFFIPRFRLTNTLITIIKLFPDSSFSDKRQVLNTFELYISDFNMFKFFNQMTHHA
ncbi:hypothetical protein BS640_11285 [Rouxiella badensis]|uniref:Uncharacterized protein n=1 Tax=Rouxiella badensis TaxID=1646377 RepID=A0A1X0WF24_9GAMM|nr:hypothetical protein BS640_11285 [Rouxiella badensis]